MSITSEKKKKCLHAAFSHLHLLESSRFGPDLCHERKMKPGSTSCVEAACNCWYMTVFVYVHACAYPVNSSSCCLGGGARFFPPQMGQLCTNKDRRKVRTPSHWGDAREKCNTLNHLRHIPWPFPFYHDISSKCPSPDTEALPYGWDVYAETHRYQLLLGSLCCSASLFGLASHTRTDSDD